MSIIKSVGSLANTSIDPLTPAGTMAAFAKVSPRVEFNVDARGRACPVGYTVRKFRAAVCGTTVTFKE
jgi:hypothetical protein